MKYAFSVVVCLLAASAVRAGSIYDPTVLAQHPIAFFPLNETSGTTANNLAGPPDNVNGTYNNVTLGIAGGPDGSGAGFDGTNSFIGIPFYSALDVTTAFSIEAWIDVTAANAMNLGSIFAINRATDGTGLSLSVDDDKLLLELNSSGTNYTEFSAGDVPFGEWAEVAVTWSNTVDGGAPQLYIDGVLVANQDSNTFTNSLVLSSSLGANIGVEFANGFDGGRYFNGDIEDVSFYNTVLSANQIAADFAAGAPEPSSLLLAGGGLLLLFAAARLAPRFR